MPRKNKSIGDNQNFVAATVQSVRARLTKWAQGQSKKATVLIPVTYNDGSEIPKHKLATIFNQIYLCSEGFTINGTVEGAYRMASGEKQVDHSTKVSVYLKQRDIPKLRTLASEWASELDQETILIEITDVQVFFVSQQHQEEAS